MPKAAIYGTTMAVLATVANLLLAVSHVGQHVLSLEAWQWVYVISVIFVAPIAAALVLRTRNRLAGAWLLLVSMAGLSSSTSPTTSWFLAPTTSSPCGLECG